MFSEFLFRCGRFLSPRPVARVLMEEDSVLVRKLAGTERAGIVNWVPRAGVEAQNGSNFVHALETKEKVAILSARQVRGTSHPTR